MSPKKPSMRQIADAAGVSVATVSHVINNVGRFSDETRDRVLAVIDEYGYVANQTAKSLRMAQSKTIGMIVPDISNDFFSKIAFHVEREMAAEGYSVFVCNSGNDPERERGYFRSLSGKQADGIICISGLRKLGDDLLVRGVPVVCIDRAPESDLAIPHVGSDDLLGSVMACERLIACGCRDILTISSFTADYLGNEREVGYLQTLAKHGIPLRRENLLYVTGRRPSIDEAEALVRDVLAGGRTPDGIFATSDHAAVGALRALRAAGLDVPGQVKIVGFDDSVYATLPTPSLTTIHRFPEQMAHEGCRVLLQLMNGKTPPMETTVPVKLVIRESC